MKYSWLPSNNVTKFNSFHTWSSRSWAPTELEFHRETLTHTTLTSISDVETTISGTGTYIFHVGPVAELEVRDGGPQPGVPAGQRAFTIVAVNNGPDDAPAAQVDGDRTERRATTSPTPPPRAASTPTPASGPSASCGKPRATTETSTAGDGEVLTIITSAASARDITATISNTRTTTVCIDSSGEDVAAATTRQPAPPPAATPGTTLPPTTTTAPATTPATIRAPARAPARPTPTPP